MFPPTRTGPPPARGLYLMSKPPMLERRAVAAMPRYSSARDPALLHLTIMGLFDLAGQPEELLHTFAGLMKGFFAYAFHVRFDRIAESGVVALSSRRQLQGAVEFQRQLTQYLRSRDFTWFGKPPRPHMTIRYGRDGVGDEAILPIGWRVDEILLIESLGGKATHIERGRWQLEPLLI